VASRILAVDYGGKRTGLAVSDALGIAAHPLPAVVSEDLGETVAGVVAAAVEKEVDLVLIGMPYLPSGLEGAQAARVRLFLGELRRKLPPGTKIEERDERYTTKMAEGLFREVGVRRRRAKPFLDSTAAVVLLREYLEELQNEAPPPAEEDPPVY